MDILNPYRDQIDEIDRRLIDLLRERYDVIEAVGAIKTKHNIPSVLQDRVDEVRDNAAEYAGQKGLDKEFIYQIWTQLIAHSCDLEDIIKEKSA